MAIKMLPELLSETAASPIVPAFQSRIRRLLRILLYIFIVLLACPIRYWPLEDGADATWRFALNYAAAQGSTVASQIVFTMGPLSCLLFPQHIGNNLMRGLLFQAGLWLVLASVLVDMFFRAGFRLRNLALFSLCFALATPLFWFNSIGKENLIVAGALMLIVVFQLRGSRLRHLAALLLIGFLPMLKLSAALIGFAVLAGFLAERAMERRREVFAEAVAAFFVPAIVTLGAWSWIMASQGSILHYLRGGMEIISGYSRVMSTFGPRMQLLSAVEALAVLAYFLNGAIIRALRPYKRWAASPCLSAVRCAFRFRATPYSGQ